MDRNICKGRTNYTQLLREGEISSDQYVTLKLATTFAEVKIAQNEKLGRAVSALGDCLANPIYEESDESETEYHKPAIPCFAPKVKKHVKRHHKRPDKERMEWQEKMGEGIMKMFEEDSRHTCEGNYMSSSRFM